MAPIAMRRREPCRRPGSAPPTSVSAMSWWNVPSDQPSEGMSRMRSRPPISVSTPTVGMLAAVCTRRGASVDQAHQPASPWSGSWANRTPHRPRANSGVARSSGRAGSASSFTAQASTVSPVPSASQGSPAAPARAPAHASPTPSHASPTAGGSAPTISAGNSASDQTPAASAAPMPPDRPATAQPPSAAPATMARLLDSATRCAAAATSPSASGSTSPISHTAQPRWNSPSAACVTVSTPAAPGRSDRSTACWSETRKPMPAATTPSTGPPARAASRRAAWGSERVGDGIGSSDGSEPPRRRDYSTTSVAPCSSGNQSPSVEPSAASPFGSVQVWPVSETTVTAQAPLGMSPPDTYSVDPSAAVCST